MSPISINGGDSIALVKAVEYLKTSMSKDLLCKFPDNSVFDFDYSQSFIWSPLLPLPPPNSAASAVIGLSRRLSYGEANEMGFLGNTKKMAAMIRRKFNDRVVEKISRCGKMKKRRKRKSFGFSVAGSGRRLLLSSSARKAWAKVKKAAVKQFKKKRKNKKINRDQNVHYHLSNCLTS